MHAILSSLGTDGDVLPFLGLGVALRRRGHRVTLGAAEHYAPLAAEHGLEFASIVSTREMRALLGNPNFWHPIKTARSTAEWGNRLILPQYEVLKRLATGNDTVLVSNPAVFGATLARETLRRPLAHLLLQPWMIPSASAPPVMPIIGLPPGAPRFLQNLFFHAISRAADFLSGRYYNKVRRSLGLKPVRNILYNWLSPDLVIGMFPKWYGPPQNDWPPQIRLADFPLFDGALQRELPTGLASFLEKPTIVFTFGSGMMHAAHLFEAAPELCRRLNVQGLYINRHHTPEQIPPHMFHSGFIPFREVFPKCAAVAHHGGVGTTAEAIAAGVPQLIVPLGFDQLDNGVRVQKHGLGLHARSKHNLVMHRCGPSDLDELEGLLRWLLQKPCTRIRLEPGLEKAADLVEELFRPAANAPN